MLPTALFEVGTKGIDIEARFVADDRAKYNSCSGRFCQHLPWHQIRVVLHLGEEDCVTRLDVTPAPRVRHQVDRLGYAPPEHHIFD